MKIEDNTYPQTMREYLRENLRGSCVDFLWPRMMLGPAQGAGNFFTVLRATFTRCPKTPFSRLFSRHSSRHFSPAELRPIWKPHKRSQMHKINVDKPHGSPVRGASSPTIRQPNCMQCVLAESYLFSKESMRSRRIKSMRILRELTITPVRVC